MISLDIVSSIATPDHYEDGVVFNEHILAASAQRSEIEFRVVSPWGFKLVEVEDFHLTEEMHPDAESFYFAGLLGRFALNGFFMTLASEGKMDVYAGENDEIELLPLFKKNQAMTALEFLTGYPGEGLA